MQRARIAFGIFFYCFALIILAAEQDAAGWLPTIAAVGGTMFLHREWRRLPLMFHRSMRENKEECSCRICGETAAYRIRLIAKDLKKPVSQFSGILIHVCAAHHPNGDMVEATKSCETMSYIKKLDENLTYSMIYPYIPTHRP